MTRTNVGLVHAREENEGGKIGKTNVESVGRLQPRPAPWGVHATHGDLSGLSVWAPSVKTCTH